MAEFGGPRHVVAASAQQRRQQPLVGTHAVQVGRIEETDADVQRVVQHGQRLGVVRRPVEIGHAHAAQAQGRNLGAGGTEAAAGGSRRTS
jgi:hypothetical protein